MKKNESNKIKVLDMYIYINEKEEREDQVSEW